MITSGAAILCTLYTLYLGNIPMLYTPAPRGDCENCCQVREPKDIQFLLYTNSNPKNPDKLFLSDKNRLTLSHLNTSNPLIIYMHGFSERATGINGRSGEQIRDAFLEVGSYNVILVDWSPLTALPWYTYSVKNGPRVARYVAKFIRFLIQSGGIPLENIHVIGFSLGAEVAGFAGKTLKEWGIMLPRITGLDPAFPLYSNGGEASRLSLNDAKFVDVIHTDGGVFGHPLPLGHADFYPNGGVPLQPGCTIQEIAKNRWNSVIFGCSHQRAWEYFVESIRRPKAFPSYPCRLMARSDGSLLGCANQMQVYMGLNTNSTVRGRFYLSTNNEKPYGNNILDD